MSILSSLEKIADERLSDCYDRSCAMVEFDPESFILIQRYIDNIPKDVIFYGDEETGTLGIPDHPHVTIVYGYRTPSEIDILNSFRYYSKNYVDITLGKLDVFQRELYNVLYISVKSNDLTTLRNMSLQSGLKIDLDYPVYTPHVTLAYIKKQAREYLEEKIGDETFNGVEVKGINLRITTITGRDCLYSFDKDRKLKYEKGEF